MPIFHTTEGFSVQGWRLKKVKCSLNHVVDLVVCTVEPSYRELSICPVDYYQCEDKSCILCIYVCDGHQDCESDEQQTECNQTVTLPTLNCPNILSPRPCTFTRKTRNDFSNVDNSHLLHCRHVLCPGMFKCRHNYCIYIVAICDGVVDCPESEDERSCLNIYCPGAVSLNVFQHGIFVMVIQIVC